MLEQQFIVDYMASLEVDVPNSFFDADLTEKLDRKGFELWDGENFIRAVDATNKHYKDRVVVPFAGRMTNDDVVAFMIEPKDRGQVVMYHAGTDPGYDRPVYYLTFTDWLDSLDDIDDQ